MSLHALRPEIEQLWERRDSVSAGTTGPARQAVDDVLAALDTGALRVAEPGAQGWIVHDWLKKAGPAVVPAE